MRSLKPFIAGFSSCIRQKSVVLLACRTLTSGEAMSSTLPSTPLSVARFKGCLVGALMGDCLGAPFETDETVSRSVLADYLATMNEPAQQKRLPYKKYTDDTAMTFALCRSLLEENGLNIPSLAKHFAEEFITDHRRGYGQAASFLLARIANEELWNSNAEDDILAPARDQFDGQGSFGNGAAMRAAPIGLFHATDPVDALIKSARCQSLITHSHGLAIIGAVLQAAAVQVALNANNSIETTSFVEALKAVVAKVEDVSDDHKRVYIKKLDNVLKYLAKKSIDSEQFLDDLGNNISAHGSVPTAIYAFLKALKPLPEFETPSGVLRTIFIAIRLGGDTDTIASMAGAIAGAYYGQPNIPAELAKHCESVDVAEDFAAKLYARIG